MSLYIHHDDHGWLHSYTKCWSNEGGVPAVRKDSQGRTLTTHAQIQTTWVPLRRDAYRFGNMKDAFEARYPGSIVLESRE